MLLVIAILTLLGFGLIVKQKEKLQEVGQVNLNS